MLEAKILSKFCPLMLSLIGWILLQLITYNFVFTIYRIQKGSFICYWIDVKCSLVPSLFHSISLFSSHSLSKPNRENGKKNRYVWSLFLFLGVMKTRTPHICQLLISLQIHHQQLFSIPYKSPISALLMHCRWIIDVFFFVHVLYSRHCIYLNNRTCFHIVVWRTSTRSLFLFEFSSSCDEYTFFLNFFLKINDGNATTHVLLNGYKKS